MGNKQSNSKNSSTESMPYIRKKKANLFKKLTDVLIADIIEYLPHDEVFNTIPKLNRRSSMILLNNVKFLDFSKNRINNVMLKLLMNKKIDKLKLHTLNLNYNSIDDSQVNMITSLPNINNLYLKGNFISAEGVQKLSAISSLKILHLNNNNLGNEGIKFLSNLNSEEGKVSELFNLRELFIGYNKIDHEGFKYLCKGEGLFKSLKVLNISSNKFDNQSMRYLCEKNRENENVEKLEIIGENEKNDRAFFKTKNQGSNKSISDLSESQLKISLEKTPSNNNSYDNLLKFPTFVPNSLFQRLHKLDISSSRFNYEGLRYLSETPNILQHLDLSNNEFGDLECQELIKTRFDHLETLIMNNCSLRDNQMKILSEGTFFKLKTLSLSHNKLRDSSAFYISQGNFFSLIQLDISFNRFEDKSLSFIFQQSYFSRNLRELNIFSNYITEDGALLIARLDLPSITNLNIGMNSIGDRGVNSLCDAKWIKNLRVLNISSVDMVTYSDYLIEKRNVFQSLIQLNIHCNNVSNENCQLLVKLYKGVEVMCS